MTFTKIKEKKSKIQVAVFGASGYTGSELVRLLSKHPKVIIKNLIGDKSKGKRLGEIFTHFFHKNLPLIQSFNDSNLDKIDVIFSCMPNGKLASIIKNIPKNTRVIDLSADFRFNEKKLYESYYDIHPAKNFLNKFVYGLSEINRNKIKKSNYISCPGCYPTSVLLTIIPLIKAGLLNIKDIIVDSKSGLSGAGRNIRENLLFAENFASSSAYGGGNHRHKPEMEHQVFLTTKKKLNVCFTPHLIPINRGILSSIYIKGDSNLVYDSLKRFYHNENFVLINNKNDSPKISDIIGSNLCKIGVIKNKNSKYTTVISVLDNLLKGASGQAIQNMNIMFNFSEELGLDNQSIWP